MSFKPVSVETTELEFAFSRRSTSAKAQKISASNLATLWSASNIEETLVNGTLLGRKSTDPKRGSQVSRKSMWEATRQVAAQLGEDQSLVLEALDVESYGDLKSSPLLEDRRIVKLAVLGTALSGWIPNVGDASFGLGGV